MLKPILIDTAAKMLLDGKIYALAKTFVRDAASTELSGPEKKEKVKSDILEIIGDVAENILNLAIEIAVLYLKSQGAK